MLAQFGVRAGYISEIREWFSNSGLLEGIEKVDFEGWTEFVQGYQTLIETLGTGELVFDQINETIDRTLEPLTEYELKIESTKNQFSAWIAQLEEMQFAEKKISDIRARETDVLDMLAEAEAERIAEEERRAAEALAASQASVSRAQAGISGQDYRLIEMQSRYGWTSIPDMGQLGNAVSAFASMTYDQVAALADRFGVFVEELSSDMTYLDAIVKNSVSEIEAEAFARRESVQAIRDSIQAMREQIGLTLYQARGGSMSAYYMGQFRAIQGAPEQSMDSLATAAEHLSSWYSAAVAEEQEVARLWAQVADITDGLIRTIDDVIVGIKTGPLSNALPSQRFASGYEVYERLRTAATGTDATQADLQNFASFAQTYLGLAQENFKSSSDYDRVRDSVLADLEAVRGDLLAGGYDEAILSELTALNENLDLSGINATFESLASWIETEISAIENEGIRLNIDFGDVPEGVRSVLEKWAAVIEENGPSSSLVVDFVVDAVAGGTDILWSDFENVIEKMGGTFTTISNLHVAYDEAAGGALTYFQVSELIDASNFGMNINTKLWGEYADDGLTLSELQEILVASNVSPELVRRITADVTGTIGVDVSRVDMGRGHTFVLEDGTIDAYTSRGMSIDGDLSASVGSMTVSASTVNVEGRGSTGEYADGGIARGPESGYPVTLHGIEAVIPLKNGAVPVQMSGGVGMRPINLTVQIIDSDGRITKQDVYKISDEVATLKFNNPSSANRRIYG